MHLRPSARLISRLISLGCFGALGALSALAGCGSEDQVLTAEDLPGTAVGDAAVLRDAALSDAQVPARDAGSKPATDSGVTTAVAADAECDLNGLWVARQQTVNVALGLPQTANNWYFFALQQQGDAVSVVEHFDCGIDVIGTVRVQLKPATVEALLVHNSQVGRRGIMKKGSDGTCTFQLERFWSVRGADEAKFAPSDRATLDSVAMLATQNPLPTKDQPAGAQDWDGDGQLGIAWYVTGIASGERHSVQRDYTEWFSDAEFRITPARAWEKDFVVRSNIGSEEVVFSASSPTLGGGGTPDARAKHRVTFHFLGRDRDAAEARRILKAKPLDTCFAIRDLLPTAEL